MVQFSNPGALAFFTQSRPTGSPVGWTARAIVDTLKGFTLVNDRQSYWLGDYGVDFPLQIKPEEQSLLNAIAAIAHDRIPLLQKGVSKAIERGEQFGEQFDPFDFLSASDTARKPYPGYGLHVRALVRDGYVYLGIHVPPPEHGRVWSGANSSAPDNLKLHAPPAPGTVVDVRMNRIGPATVLSTFDDHGYTGCSVVPHNPPEWFSKQNGPFAVCSVFGAEISALTPA